MVISRHFWNSNKQGLADWSKAKTRHKYAKCYGFGITQNQLDYSHQTVPPQLWSLSLQLPKKHLFLRCPERMKWGFTIDGKLLGACYGIRWGFAWKGSEKGLPLPSLSPSFPWITFLLFRHPSSCLLPTKKKKKREREREITILKEIQGLSNRLRIDQQSSGSTWPTKLAVGGRKG